ncbi:MAG: TSUP family transporter, partial [Candidatus Angelobacter sp.]
LQGFDVRKETLVATATAIALIVDGARMPVYFTVESSGILKAWPLLAVALSGVLLGTFWGVRLLRRIPEPAFRKLLNCLIIALGIYMVAHGAAR